MARLVIQIRPTGEVNMHVQHVQGKKCLKITKQLEDGLGKITDKKLTSEFFQQTPPVIINKQILSETR